MIELWYRFNLFAERQFFEKELNLADGLMVPLNLVAYYGIAIPELLRDCNLPFLIDPVSYYWGISRPPVPSGGKQKKSFAKLTERLDTTVASMLGKQPVQTLREGSPEFDELINRFMQSQFLFESTEKQPRRQSIERIKRKIGKIPEKEQACIRPYALIPFYLLFNNVEGNPYSKTVYAARFAKDSSYGNQYRIYPCLCMDRSILTDEGQLEKIVDDFKEYKGIILWINNFDETDASLEELTNVVHFIHNISRQKTEVINFYGGYFSLMLSYVGLSKLSCGICYSRSRDASSQASGGGLPLRYYEPHLKIKLPNEDVFRLYSDIPELFTCDCPICSDYARKVAQAGNTEDKGHLLQEFFVGDPQKEEGGFIDWTRSRLHFLHSQKLEQRELEQRSRIETIANIEATYNHLKTHLDPIKYGIKPFEHLKLWADSLKQITDVS
jgi:hypothetical protein